MLAVFTKCAQITPLTGGSRDLVPPKLVEAKPLNASLNFTGNTIELKFDEFIKVTDLSNQVIITPQTKEMPLIEARGKKVLVTFNETLRPNTTYRIFFGNSIVDMREGNKLTDFEFVFSTGSSIDSLYTEGRIVNAFNAKLEKDVMVALYDSTDADSVVYKKKPLYFTKSRDGGRYHMSYLPKSAFRAVAFTDKNKNLMYDGGEEMVAFKDSLLRTGSDTLVNFKLFKEESPRQFVKKSYSPVYGLAYIIYNKDLLNKAVPFYADQKDNVLSAESINDTCKIYYHHVYDSLKVLVYHREDQKIDTLNITVPPSEVIDKQKKSGKILLDMSVEPSALGKLPFNKQPVLVFNKWMDFTVTDTSKIRLVSKKDSAVQAMVVLKEPGIDRIVIENRIKPSADYKLVMKKGAFTDRNGIESDSAALIFNSNSAEDYGRLNLKLTLPSKENFIVQLLTAQDKVIAQQYLGASLASSVEQTLLFNYLLPGEYFVKVIEDKNKNEKWDTGNLIQQKQPESIYFNTQPVKLLADWDADIEWKINPE
ncbi:MAG: Ig-like domain-containing protein [Bacteroidia bacterium]